MNAFWKNKALPTTLPDKHFIIKHTWYMCRKLKFGHGFLCKLL